MPYPLPDEIDPPRLSVCVPVPDDPQHRRAFLAQLQGLAYYWNWEKDSTKSLARDAAAVWREIYYIVTQRIDDQEECGMDCCDGLIDALNKLGLYNARKENEERVAAYDGSPTSINPSAPTDTFADSSADRRTGLCLAIWGYVVSQINARAQRDCAESAAIIALILGGLGSFFGPVGGIIGGLVGGVVGGLVCDDLTAWASDEEAIKATVCEIYNSLTGVTINQNNFELAFQSLVAGGDQIQEALAADASKLENYLFFLDLLGEGYDQAVNGVESECDCQPMICTFDFRISSYDIEFDQGSRRPGDGLINSTEHLAGNWRLSMQMLEFPDGHTCGGSTNIYYRYEVTKTGGGGVVTLALQRSGTQVIGGPINVPVGTTFQTGLWSSGGTGPAEGFQLFIFNGTGNSNIIIHSLELSDTPF